MTILKTVCPGYTAADKTIHRCGKIISQKEVSQADWHDKIDKPLVIITYEKCSECECLENVSRETMEEKC